MASTWDAAQFYPNLFVSLYIWKPVLLCQVSTLLLETVLPHKYSSLSHHFWMYTTLIGIESVVPVEFHNGHSVS